MNRLVIWKFYEAFYRLVESSLWCSLWFNGGDLMLWLTLVDHYWLLTPTFICVKNFLMHEKLWILHNHDLFSWFNTLNHFEHHIRDMFSRITHLNSQKFSWFSYKRWLNFSIEIKNVAKIVYFAHKKTRCSSIKRKHDIFREKNCGFVDSEFV